MLPGVPHKTQRPAARPARVLSSGRGGPCIRFGVACPKSVLLCSRRCRVFNWRYHVQLSSASRLLQLPEERRRARQPHAGHRSSQKLSHVEISAVDVAAKMVRVEEATRSGWGVWFGAREKVGHGGVWGEHDGGEGGGGQLVEGGWVRAAVGVQEE